MTVPRETINSFALVVANILKSDRWVFLGCSGDMGEGKSCFTDKLTREVSKITKTGFEYKNNMTYLRSQLKNMIDGDEKGKNQLPEYSSLLVDELISLFFKRNWFDSEQIDGVELLNKCRDRHLFVAGNIPKFWDLDSAILPIFSFWIHIHERGRAWVFKKSRNPFASDSWYKKENEKLWKKHKNPYSCNGFVCEIVFDDWSKSEKKNYYEARNIMRKNTEGQRDKTKLERYADIKFQRDELLKYAFSIGNKIAESIKCFKETNENINKLDYTHLESWEKAPSQTVLSDISGLSRGAIGHILRGER